MAKLKNTFDTPQSILNEALDKTARAWKTLLYGYTGSAWGAVSVDADGHLQIDVLTMPTVAVTGTFWQATQPVSGTVTAELSAVDNAVLDVIAAKDFATQTTLAAINAKLVTGTVIGDVNLGATDNAVLDAIAASVAAATPAGTNAIGKLLPPDVDVTAHTNYVRKYYTSAGAATDGIIWSPGAGKRWHVAWISINVSAAATVTLEDDKSAGDDPVWKAELAANGGVFMTFPDQYPMSSGEDAADLTITTSAGNVYVSCGGWEI